MSTKKTRAQQRKDLVAFTKFVHGTLHLMAAGQPIRMIVNVVDMRGQNLVIQTVSGHPNPPNPPTPGARLSGVI